MKWIKYQIVCNEDKDILLDKKVGYSDANLAIAQNEAYNGEYSIEEDGTPEPSKDAEFVKASQLGDYIRAGAGIFISEFTDPTNHISIRVGGTFTNQVKAGSTYQTPGNSLIRNSKLVSSDTNPTVSGEICWTYE